MFRFFTVVEDAGVEQKHLANLMDVHPSLFTHIKHGRRVPSLYFMQQAVSALVKIGLRKEDGTPFTADDLFFAPMDSILSKSYSDVVEGVV